jgi:precorrin-6A synthase
VRTILVIGIGAGNPDQLTVQAVKALNRADAFFVLDKGAAKDDLVRLRREILGRHVDGEGYRIVEARDPERDRAPSDYTAAVSDWHERRAAMFERMILDELDEDECGAFLVWGDPSLYDSTIDVIERILAGGEVTFEYDVIPGISSVHALTARHRIALNRVGGAVQITTGRRLARDGWPEGVDDLVVMLDADCSFGTLDPEGVEIYWGAYLGTPDELLASGRLADVADEIRRVRAEARERKGWIMDTYVLRRSGRSRASE